MALASRLDTAVKLGDKIGVATLDGEIYDGALNGVSTTGVYLLQHGGVKFIDWHDISGVWLR